MTDFYTSKCILVRNIYLYFYTCLDPLHSHLELWFKKYLVCRTFWTQLVFSSIGVLSLKPFQILNSVIQTYFTQEGGWGSFCRDGLCSITSLCIGNRPPIMKSPLCFTPSGTFLLLRLHLWCNPNEKSKRNNRANVMVVWTRKRCFSDILSLWYSIYILNLSQMHKLLWDVQALFKAF